MGEEHLRNIGERNVNKRGKQKEKGKKGRK
jgi:hypothetical protein